MDGFEGHVDGLENGWAWGWAWHAGRPLDPIAVDAYVDDEHTCTCLANLYRADLAKAERGDGRHAFEVSVSSGARPGSTIRIVFAGTSRDLTGSPIVVTKEAPGLSDAAALASGGPYRSRFGGLWPDLSNSLQLIHQKESLRAISPEETDLLKSWVRDGFVVLPAAVSSDLIDQLDADVEEIWNGVSPFRCFVEFWESDAKTIQPAGERFRNMPVKLLDLYVHSENARKIIFSPAIVRFLTVLFEQPVLAFQSLYFRFGSRQDIHQDTAFVKVSSPLAFAASWIALEDIQPDSGELEYYVGSHTLEDYLFAGRSKWMPFRSSEYSAFVESLHQRSQARGLARRKFRPRKGDALIWSADLAHGGSQQTSEGVTRKSIVSHYCPATCEPVYRGAGPAARRQFRDGLYYSGAPRE
jgi:phytanoyl-CoA hydroxylase